MVRKRNNIGIVGEGLTEKWYFTHLKRLKGYSCVIKPKHFFTRGNVLYIEKRTKEFLAAGMIVICVFDTDLAERSDAEKKKVQAFKTRYGRKKDVIICDSLPSIEFWFLIHYKKTNRQFTSYNQIRQELLKDLPGYEKTEKYLQQDTWVRCLIEKQEEAIANAQSLASGGSYSNIYKAIELLEKS